MFIKVDFTSDVPIYEQIKNQIIEGIAKGELKDGHSLPTIRQLAEDIGVNMHTVNKAYNELKNLGFIFMTKRLGAFIRVNKGYDEGFLEDLCSELKPIIAKAYCKGVEKEKIIKIIDEIYEGFGGQGK